MLGASAVDPGHVVCLLIPIAVWVGIITAASQAAERRNTSVGAAILLATFLGPIGLLIVVLSGRTPEAEARHQAAIAAARQSAANAAAREAETAAKRAEAERKRAELERLHAAGRAEADRRLAEYERERREIEARGAIEERAWREDQRQARREAAERAKTIEAACPRCGVRLLVHPTEPCVCGGCGERLAAMRGHTGAVPDGTDAARGALNPEPQLDRLRDRLGAGGPTVPNQATGCAWTAGAAGSRPRAESADRISI